MVKTEVRQYPQKVLGEGEAQTSPSVSRLPLADHQRAGAAQMGPGGHTHQSHGLLSSVTDYSTPESVSNRSI